MCSGVSFTEVAGRLAEVGDRQCWQRLRRRCRHQWDPCNRNCVFKSFVRCAFFFLATTQFLEFVNPGHNSTNYVGMFAFTDVAIQFV